MGDLMYESRYEHIVSLITDLFWFFLNSVYYILETIYLTILPDRFRKMKVYALRLKRSDFNQLTNKNNKLS